MRLDIFLCHDAKSAPVSISQQHGQHYVAYVMSQNRIRYCQQLSLAKSFAEDWEEEGGKGGGREVREEA